MQNAISSYEYWYANITRSLKLSGDYENVLDKFSLQRKTVRGYIALCDRYSLTEECLTFLELLDDELAEDSTETSTLTSQFVEFWNDNAVDLSNEKRMDFLFAMLCVATDHIIMREDGMIEFGVKPRQLEHEEMEKKGVYRKFLA